MAAPRKCVICKTEYSYCPHCGKDDPTKTWMTTFCSENCREIYKVCNEFTHKRITANQAKKKLDKYEVGDYEKYAPTISSAIKEIMIQKKNK